MTNQQFIVVGRADDDLIKEAPLCLLTRRVFTSLEKAREFADHKYSQNRDAQIVQCYFTVPQDLYPNRVPDNWDTTP